MNLSLPRPRLRHPQDNFILHLSLGSCLGLLSSRASLVQNWDRREADRGPDGLQRGAHLPQGVAEGERRDTLTGAAVGGETDHPQNTSEN